MLYQLGKFCLKEKPLPALSPPPMCEICGEFQETTEHFLLLCSWTSVVWYGSSLNTGRKKEVSHAKADMEKWRHICVVILKKGTPCPRTTIDYINNSISVWEEAKHSVAQLVVSNTCGHAL
ncbi:hypothetical protein ACLB2K_066663 [Fragaria x ananassa]